jgi:hypothetical protein
VYRAEKRERHVRGGIQVKLDGGDSMKRRCGVGSRVGGKCQNQQGGKEPEKRLLIPYGIIRYRSIMILSRKTIGAKKDLLDEKDEGKLQMATTRVQGRNILSRPVLLRHGRTFSEIPAETLVAQLARVPASMTSRLAFMSEEHHLVRNFAVRELPREGRRALDPGRLAETIGLPAKRVLEILSDLESALFFLVRNAAGSISWAFPVTVETTSHRLTFSTGEQTHGA